MILVPVQAVNNNLLIDTCTISWRIFVYEMKRIALRNGGYTQVSDEDYNELSRWDWRKSVHGYVYRQRKASERTKESSIIFMHRVITSAPKGISVDHINRDRLNNQRSNLRLCIDGLNQWNKSKYRTYAGRKTTSRFKGVALRDKNKPWSTWRATIAYKGNIIRIGNFAKEHWAAMAYDIWAKELYGEFASTNF